MAVPLWQPGTLYLPGDLVRPTNSGTVGAATLDNANFELGAVDWTISGTGNGVISNAIPVFDGSWALQLNDTGGGSPKRAVNDARLPCTPGQLVVMRCYAMCAGDHDRTRLMPVITWYNAANVVIAHTTLAADPTNIFGHVRVDATYGIIGVVCTSWTQLTVEGEAPALAAFWTAEVRGEWLPDGLWYVDTFTAEYASGEAPNLFVYRAVQAASGFSGGTEPVWPQTLGVQVVDNEVTWECIPGNTVTWEASRILVSGAIEPTWPLAVGSVPDNTIVWTLDSRRVNDENRPGSDIVVIGASKVFAADGDIVNFSATVNPLDWTTLEDAGYLPFGLQNYGANPVAAMGLYRGNLAVFNSQGCQIWQIDEDPSGMDFLDAIPIPCTFPKSLAPVGDDLAFLSNLGIRSLGLAGSSINLQAGYFGKHIDPLVLAEIEALEENGYTPRGLYWPARGQYWLFFGAQAFVLTMNGDADKDRSWSRYTFPSAIDDWTLLGTDLMLRSGDLVWRVDPEALLDDLHDEGGLSFNLTVAEDGGAIAWGYEIGTFGSVLPTPMAVGDATIFILQTTNGWTEIFLDEAEADVFPEQYELMRIVTPHGTYELDLTAPDDQDPWYYAWETPIWDEDDIGEVSVVSFPLDSDQVGTEFTGVIHWPYLDLGSFNADKELAGFDLTIDGTCMVSIGYDQRYLDYDATGPWTEAYAIDGDTAPGQMIPFSVTGPSFALRLEFAPNQAWQWYSANLYVQDMER